METVETTSPAQSETPAQTTATSTPEALDITNYINNDGTFKENYKELVPEDLRGNKFYDIFHDVQGIMKAAGHQAVTLGKYGTTKGILPINEKSSPQEIESYRAAMGVPKDAAGYKYTPPDDISLEDMSPEYMQETFTALNKSNLNQSQVDTVVGLYANHLRQVEKAVNEELARGVSDAENLLQGEWGDKFESRTNLARAFITKMASGWSPEKYNSLFGKEVKGEDGTTTREGGINDPEFAPLRPYLLDLFANIEEKYGIEDTALAAESGGTAAKSIDSQIQEIEATPGFMDGKLRGSMDSRDREKYEALIKQRDLLYKKLYPV